MHDFCVYQIEIQGQAEENVFNAASPIQVTVVRADPAATLIRLHGDQSGLIGLIRHLHQQGFVLLSVVRKGKKNANAK